VPTFWAHIISELGGVPIAVMGVVDTFGLLFPKLFLNDKIYIYTKKTYLAHGNLAKLMFWSILLFKNLQDFSQFFW
jgi:hypothetical protein